MDYELGKKLDSIIENQETIIERLDEMEGKVEGGDENSEFEEKFEETEQPEELSVIPPLVKLPTIDPLLPSKPPVKKVKKKEVVEGDELDYDEDDDID